MRLEFQAVDGGFGDDRDETYCLICGFSGPDADGVEHYLNFTRGFENEDPSDDWGIHCEFDDQINGTYNCIERCWLTRTMLEVNLSRPIDWQKKYTGICVDISGLDEPAFAAIRDALPRLFRGTTAVLDCA